MNLARKIVARFLATKYSTSLTSDLALLIENQVSSMTDEIPHEEQKKALGRVKVTAPVKEKATAWDAAVEHALVEWCGKHMDSLRLGEAGPLSHTETADQVVDVMMGLRGGASYRYYMEHEGAGVGTWDGDWDVFFKNPRTTIKVLSQYVLGATHSQYKALQEAIFDAALDTMPDEGTEKQAARAFRGYATLEDRVKVFVHEVHGVRSTLDRALGVHLAALGAYRGAQDLLKEVYNTLDKVVTLLVEDTGVKTARRRMVQADVGVNPSVKMALHGVHVGKEQIERQLKVPFLAMSREEDLPKEAMFAIKQAFQEVLHALDLLDDIASLLGAG